MSENKPRRSGSSRNGQSGPRLIFLLIGAGLSALGWLFMRNRNGGSTGEPPEVTPAGNSSDAPLSSPYWKSPFVDFQPERDHDRHEVRLGRIVLLLGLLVMVAGCGVVAITIAELSFSGQPLGVYPPPVSLTTTPEVQRPGGAALEPLPGVSLEQLRSYEDAQLNSYGWTDPQAGTTRIPIDRAMQIIAQRGLPARPPAANGQSSDQGLTLPSGASSGRVMEQVIP